ncbi:hypothetical protein NKI04_21985, partial [Mesorhizobium sp. M0814]
MARLYSGKAKEAIQPVQRGLRLNPFDSQNFHWFRVLALAMHFSGEKEAALQYGKRYFRCTLTRALSTDGLRIGNGIWSDQAAVALA